MIVCPILMLFVAGTVLSHAFSDCVGSKTDAYYHAQKSWPKLPRIDQAMRIFYLKRNFYRKNNEIELSPSLYKYCAKKDREKNKIRFGVSNKPKAHQSWVVVRDYKNAPDGDIYHFPLSQGEVTEILNKIDAYDCDE